MTLEEIVARIVNRAEARVGDEALLVAVSGIDGSGKSTLAPRIRDGVGERGLNAVLIGLDPWHTPPSVRFGAEEPGRHFYEHAFRFEEFFGRLVDPLKRRRSLRLTVELTRLPENDVVPVTYDFREVDVILLEGIFLLKREWRHRYDLAFWIECSFETALRRAVARNQEGLPPEGIIRDFETIYFPAQRVHIARDAPRDAVDGILLNDG